MPSLTPRQAQARAIAKQAVREQLAQQSDDGPTEEPASFQTEADKSFITVDDALVPSSALHSRVSGDSLRECAVRKAAHFWIEAHEASGNRRTSGGDIFNVIIRGPAQVRARVSDNGDGTYLAVFKPSTSGRYAISVSMGGVQLPDSPFACTALPALPCAAHCEVRGKALHSAISRQQQQFDILFRDKLQQVSHAVDLDVFVEQLPMTSPRNRETPLTEAELKRREAQSHARGSRLPVPSVLRAPRNPRCCRVGVLQARGRGGAGG